MNVQKYDKNNEAKSQQITERQTKMCKDLEKDTQNRPLFFVCCALGRHSGGPVISAVRLTTLDSYWGLSVWRAECGFFFLRQLQIVHSRECELLFVSCFKLGCNPTFTLTPTQPGPTAATLWPLWDGWMWVDAKDEWKLEKTIWKFCICTNSNVFNSGPTGS